MFSWTMDIPNDFHTNRQYDLHKQVYIKMFLDTLRNSVIVNRYLGKDVKQFQSAISTNLSLES